MTRCPYCGELFLGDRDGIGTHVSSVVIGLVSGLVSMALLTMVATIVATT